MISSVEDLLAALREAGVAENEQFSDIGHPVLIGGMYEGLTKKIMQAALFSPFDLRVASGKIRSVDGTYSPQIDCMLVAGDGIQIPNLPSEHIYEIGRVIAVLEVKKTLSRTELGDALKKLRRTADLAINNKVGRRANLPTTYRIHSDAFRAVWRKPFPINDKPDDLNDLERDVFYMLLGDSMLPIRIVWSYGGYKTEDGLRDAFISCTKEALDPFLINIPNLVICGDLSIVKANGMPFVPGPAQTSDRMWDICYSQPKLALRNFLNILWYRLTKLYQKDFLWLTDGKVYEHTPLLSLDTDASGRRILTVWEPGRGTALSEAAELEPEPFVVSIEEFVLIQALIAGEVISVANATDFVEQLDRRCEATSVLGSAFETGIIVRRIDWKTVEDLLDQLSRSGLLAREQDLLRLTTSRCFLLMSSEGMFAGENRDGRFSHRFGAQGLFHADSDPSQSTVSVFMRPRSLVGAKLPVPPRKLPIREKSGPILHGVLEPLQRWLDAWIAQGLRTKEMPPRVSLSIERGDEFDAKASYKGPNDYEIRIADAVDLLLRDICFRFLAHPAIFTEIGRPGSESAPRRMSQFHTTLEQLGQEVRPYALTVPKCEDRKQYAMQLHRLAMDFVFFHLFSHVMLGHLRLLHETGVSELEERNVATDPALSTTDRQTLEWSADMMAVEYLICSHAQLRKTASIPFYGDLGDFVLLIERALAIVTMLPERAWYPGIEPALSHPPPPWRFVACMQAVAGCLRRTLSVERDSLKVPVTSAAGDIIAARTALTWAKFDRSRLAAEFSNPAKVQLLQVWKERIRPRLERCAHLSSLMTTD